MTDVLLMPRLSLWASVLAAVLLGVCMSATAHALPVGAITEFNIPTANSRPFGIAAGPDGNMWFTEERANKIGRITPTGQITEFNIPTPDSGPRGITAGPDGNMWFTEHEGNKIGRITPTGEITEFNIPTANSRPYGIAAGPDGEIWFTESTGGEIAKITPTGEITEFEMPNEEGNPVAIAPGPDGNMWFTDEEGNEIGQITPTGEVTEFPVPTAESWPLGIAPGMDGNMWFTEEEGEKIGRITPSGTINEFAIPAEESPTYGIAPGPDGNMWFTGGFGDDIGRITPAGKITEFEMPSEGSDPVAITAGPDGNMWFTEAGDDAIGRISVGVAGALASPAQIGGGGQVGVPQSCELSWASWASHQPSDDLDPFDGYRWMLNGSQIASGGSYTPTAAEVGQRLSCSETVTYPLLGVTALASSASLNVVAASPGASLSRPVITAAHQSASSWREGGALAQMSAKHRRKSSKPPIGSTFSFSLNEQATVSFTFTAEVTGRKVGHQCMAKSPKNARRKSCKHATVVGAFSFTGHGAVNRITFQGRISRSHKLALGHYTLTIAATNSAGSATSQKLRFTIVK